MEMPWAQAIIAWYEPHRFLLCLLLGLKNRLTVCLPNDLEGINLANAHGRIPTFFCVGHTDRQRGTVLRATPMSCEGVRRNSHNYMQPSMNLIVHALDWGWRRERGASGQLPENRRAHLSNSTKIFKKCHCPTFFGRRVKYLHY